jgi:hypothetical protein
MQHVIVDGYDSGATPIGGSGATHEEGKGRRRRLLAQINIRRVRVCIKEDEEEAHRSSDGFVVSSCIAFFFIL